MARPRFRPGYASFHAAAAGLVLLAAARASGAVEEGRGAGGTEDISSSRGAVTLPAAGAATRGPVEKSETPRQAPTGETGRRHEIQQGMTTQPASALPLQRSQEKSVERPTARSANRSVTPERDEFCASELRAEILI